MAALTREDVLAIARLARLHLEPEEVARLRGELSAILEHMERLAAVDTAGVEPMTHAVPMELRLRADQAEAPLSVEDAVGQAPDRDGDLFRVPHILKTAAAGSSAAPAAGAAGSSAAPAAGAEEEEA